MQQISRYQLVTTMVHVFFDAFFTGLIDASGQKPSPRLLKQHFARQYEHVFDYLFHVMFPLLLPVNFDSYEEACADMKRRRFSDNTPKKLLLRYACGNRQLFDALADEYRRQMDTLLNGRLQNVQDHVRLRGQGNDCGLIGADKAVRATVRTAMHAYALGIKAAGNGKTSLHQPSVLRLMADSMAILLHEEALDVWADAEQIGLDGVFRRVAGDDSIYELIIDEMNEAYVDLAVGEGMTSPDDRHD